jgi:hypothetical protein
MRSSELDFILQNESANRFDTAENGSPSRFASMQVGSLSRSSIPKPAFGNPISLHGTALPLCELDLSNFKSNQAAPWFV